MGQLGFYCFTQPTPVIPLTMRQRIALMSDADITKILNGFINKRTPQAVAIEKGLPSDIVVYLYEKMDEIQVRSKQYMRGEVVITPEVSHIDPVTHLKVIDTPAVFNTPPTTQTQLRDLTRPEFVDDFPVSVYAAICTAMINWSKYDGTGTFAFYKSQIIL